jgi:hypothetical protein
MLNLSLSIAADDSADRDAPHKSLAGPDELRAALYRGVGKGTRLPRGGDRRVEGIIAPR